MAPECTPPHNVAPASAGSVYNPLMDEPKAAVLGSVVAVMAAVSAEGTARTSAIDSLLSDSQTLRKVTRIATGRPCDPSRCRRRLWLPQAGPRTAACRTIRGLRELNIRKPADRGC